MPALLIGLGYACLYLFGTMIYLDAREFTFCVPVNRAGSLLSGAMRPFRAIVANLEDGIWDEREPYNATRKDLESSQGPR